VPSASGLALLFGYFAGTMQLLDSSITCIPDLSALGFLQTARVLSRGRDRGLPVLAHEVSLRARGLRLRRVRVMLALSHHPVLPSPCVQKVGTLNWVFEALYLARKCLCLRLACRLTTARPRLEVRMVRYSFPVRLFHSLLHAGLSRRIGRLPFASLAFVRSAIAPAKRVASPLQAKLGYAEHRCISIIGASAAVC
jgi:hypothetical protein